MYVNLWRGAPCRTPFGGVHLVGQFLEGCTMSVNFGGSNMYINLWKKLDFIVYACYYKASNIEA